VERLLGAAQRVVAADVFHFGGPRMLELVSFSLLEGFDLD
jgi:hypothetical protein